MGQEDILKCLRRAKKPLSATEIAKRINRCKSTISTQVKKLRERQEVKYVLKKMKNRQMVYHYYI